MTHAGARCGVCGEQNSLLALFGEEGDLANQDAITNWHDEGHPGAGPFTPEEPGEWAGKTTQALTIQASDLEVRDDEQLCTVCWRVHRPGVCDR